MSYGYRVDQISLPPLKSPDSTFKLVRQKDMIKEVGPPARVTLGCHLVGAALPVPDTTYPLNALTGTIKRVCCQMPRIKRPILRKLNRFVRKYCNRFFAHCRFNADEDFDIDEWLQDANYTLSRKEELKNKFLKIMNPKMRAYMRVKAFVKDEAYVEYKYPRGIYSRTDEFKCLVGPLFAKMNKILFSTPDTIKKIPVNQRMKFIKEKFEEHYKLFCTDFSQFEATFVPMLQECTEMYFYGYLLQNHPARDYFMNLIRKTLLGEQYIEFKNFVIKIMGKRMSGEMNTSLANTWTNMMISYFLVLMAGSLSYKGVFEGDDGINNCIILPTSKQYAELGAIIKIEEVNNVSEASFCGNVFDPEALDNVTDPRETLISFGWTTAKYTNSTTFKLKYLLRAKAMSLIHEYPGCPILRSLAHYALRVTSNIPNHKMEEFNNKHIKNTYLREQWFHVKNQEIENKEVHINSRMLVEKLYSISIPKQLEIEKYLDSLNVLQPLEIPSFVTSAHPDQRHYYDNYVVSIPLKEHHLDRVSRFIAHRHPISVPIGIRSGKPRKLVL